MLLAQLATAWHRLQIVKLASAMLLVVALVTVGCATSSESPSPSQPNRRDSTRWFTAAELAVKTNCHAYWVGLYIKGTQRTQLQWETKTQYRSGDGQVAGLERSASGVRLRQCRVADYAHA